MRPIALLTASIAAAGISVLSAQAPREPDTSRQTFRSATRLVQVSVVVHDGRRRPVADLKAEDFEILEDGKSQPVSLFSVRGPAPSAAATEAAGVFTNRLQSPGNGGAVAIVFDRLNTSFTEQSQARAHIIKYLGQLRPEDRVALFVLGNDGMRILHDFSKDAASLLRTLNRAKAADSPLLAAATASIDEQMTAELDAFARGNLENTRAFFGRVIALTSLEALEDIAAYLSGIPGRKNLIWVSSGFPFAITHFGPGGTSDITLMSNETRRATRALNNSDVAVYPVDARGLVGAFATHPAERVQTFSTLASTMGPIEGLRHVADWTGGRAFFNTNDLGSAIGGAVRDSDLTYVLGYYPADQDWNDRFRKIKVKVRRKGVEVRHRSGYFAVAPEPADTGTRQQAIMDALNNVLEVTSLPMSVAVTQADKGRLTLTITLDGAAPTLVRENNRWVGSVDVAIAQTLPPGRHAKEADAILPLSLTDEAREQMLRDGLTITRTIDLNPEAHQVRIVARDATSGTTGSVIITASDIGNRERPSTLLRGTGTR